MNLVEQMHLNKQILTDEQVYSHEEIYLDEEMLFIQDISLLFWWGSRWVGWWLGGRMVYGCVR